jgi:hypothetical protein
MAHKMYTNINETGCVASENEMTRNDELEGMRKEKATKSLDVEPLFELLHEGTEENNENI